MAVPLENSALVWSLETSVPPTRLSALRCACEISCFCIESWDRWQSICERNSPALPTYNQAAASLCQSPHTEVKGWRDQPMAQWALNICRTPTFSASGFLIQTGAFLPCPCVLTSWVPRCILYCTSTFSTLRETVFFLPFTSTLLSSILKRDIA